MAHVGKWSTEKYNEVLEHLNRTGTLPKLNPFFDGNVEWKQADVKWAYTKTEFLELVKCQQNILYFGENHCEVMTDKGVTNVKLRPYQRKVLLQFRKYRNNVYTASRQCGKCVEFDTKIEVSYTPTGELVASIPLFELYYKYKKYLTIGDRIEWFLYRIAYYIKKKINRLEVRIAGI